MIWRSQRTSKINQFVKTNSPSDIIGTPGDNWKSYLKNHGGVGETFHDLESSWAESQGATGGTFRDNIRTVVRLAGFLTGTAQDALRDYLSSTLSTDSFYLLEDGVSFYLLENGTDKYILE